MITADYQSLEPGNKVRLIEVDGSTFGVDDVLRFHAYNLPHTEEEIAAAGGDESKLKAKVSGGRGRICRLAVSN